MKRPKLVTTVALLQLVWGAFLACLALYAWREASSMTPTGFLDSLGRDIVYSVAKSSGAAGAMLLVTDYGLWKRHRWAWALAVATNLVGLLFRLHETSFRAGREIWVSLVFAAILALLLLPPVLKFYFARPTGADV